MLTDRLVRFEYSANNTYEDRATFAFINRNLPKVSLSTGMPTTLIRHCAQPEYTVTRSGDNGTIKTDYLTIYITPASPNSSSICKIRQKSDILCPGHCSEYRLPVPGGIHSAAACCNACQDNRACNSWVMASDECYLLSGGVGFRPAADRVAGGNFHGATSDSIRVELKSGQKWSPGDAPVGNLLGTLKSLDGKTGPVSMDCISTSGASECGLAPISRDGWAVYDDSDDDIIDAESGWITPRGSSPTNSEDLYFFGHGNDYKAALKDFTKIAGTPKAPPRFTLGVWWYVEHKTSAQRSFS